MPSDAPSSVQERPHQGWNVLAFMAVLLLLLVASVLFASRFFMPIRAYNGEWILTRSNPIPRTYDLEDARKGARVRYYVWGVDWIPRREYDWDGDGRYDCREDDCPYKSKTRWSACVSHHQGWSWIPAPPDVIECVP